MSRILLTALLVILGSALSVMNPPLAGLLALAVWIYLAWMVSVHGAGLFEGRVDPPTAERLLKRLKMFLRLAGLAFVAFLVAVVLHNVLSARIEGEEAAWFFLALAALGVFILATVGALVTFLGGRRRAD